MTRVVLVEDHDMVAEAIGLALERAGIEVIARATSVATAVPKSSMPPRNERSLKNPWSTATSRQRLDFGLKSRLSR